MENGRQLQVGLYRHFAGDIVTLDVLRADRVEKLPVAVGERPDSLEGVSAAIDPRLNLVARLSILGVDLDRRLAEILPVRRVRSGVVVASSVEGALDARDGGLAAGDVIYAVNRTPVRDLAQLRQIIDALQPGDAVVLQLERRGELMYLAFTLE